MFPQYPDYNETIAASLNYNISDIVTWTKKGVIQYGVVAKNKTNELSVYVLKRFRGDDSRWNNGKWQCLEEERDVGKLWEATIHTDNPSWYTDNIYKCNSNRYAYNNNNLYYIIVD